MVFFEKGILLVGRNLYTQSMSRGAVSQATIQQMLKSMNEWRDRMVSFDGRNRQLFYRNLKTGDVDEGYQETMDNSGLTIEMFTGSHYAIGALKGFWTPTKDGFRVIDQAILDLEKLLSDDERESSIRTSHKQESDPISPLRSPSSEKPDARASWRITRTSDGSDGFFYTTQGVNGYTVGKYYEDVQPGVRVEIDGKDLLPSEIPLDYEFVDDNISDALLIWLENEFNIEVIRETSKQFEVNVEIDGLEDLVSVWDLSDPSSRAWGYFNLSEYKLIDCINEVMQSFDNFRVIFIGGAS